MLPRGRCSKVARLPRFNTQVTAQVLSRPKAEGGLGLHAVHSNEIYRSVGRLTDVLGACERSRSSSK